MSSNVTNATQHHSTRRHYDKLSHYSCVLSISAHMRFFSSITAGLHVFGVRLCLHTEKMAEVRREMNQRAVDSGNILFAHVYFFCRQFAVCRRLQTTLTRDTRCAPWQCHTQLLVTTPCCLNCEP